MAGTSRARVPMAEQIRLINECRQSGMTDADWCRENDIAVSTFYNWVSRCRKAAADQIPPPNYGHLEVPRPKQDVVPIGIVPDHISELLIAFTALIPIFGAFIGCAVGTVLIFMVNPMQALMFIIMFFLLQQIEGNLIYPHVVGNSVGLPSIWVLVAVSIGGSLMGIVGMLIFIPLVSVVYSLFRGIVNRRLERKNIKVQ